MTRNPIDTIRESYASLTRTQQRIADYTLSSGDSVCFMSLKELSQNAKVSTVTLLSFCKNLGYESFSDFKKALQEYFQALLSPRRVVKEEAEAFQSHSQRELAAKLIGHEQRLLSDTLQCQNLDTLTQVALLLLRARRIYLIGKGLSTPVIDLLKTRLDFLCKESHQVSLNNLNLLPNRILNAGKEDVFLVFTFPNYSPIIGSIAKAAKEQLGSKVVCITDSITAPPAAYADILLLCKTSGLVYYNSMTSPIAMVNIIVSLMAVSAARDETKLEALSHLSLEQDSVISMAQMERK